MSRRREIRLSLRRYRRPMVGGREWQRRVTLGPTTRQVENAEDRKRGERKLSSVLWNRGRRRICRQLRRINGSAWKVRLAGSKFPAHSPVANVCGNSGDDRSEKPDRPYKRKGTSSTVFQSGPL